MSWAALWKRDPVRAYALAKDAARFPPVVRQWVVERRDL